jgi:hypothetical protein
MLIQPLTIREFVYKFVEDENVFTILPIFSFLKPLSEKWKAQNCACGLGPDIHQAIQIYNEVVTNLHPDIVEAVRLYFGLTQVCFAIQTPDSHEIKCY